jgi:hypothetical protein
MNCARVAPGGNLARLSLAGGYCRVVRRQDMGDVTTFRRQRSWGGSTEVDKKGLSTECLVRAPWNSRGLQNVTQGASRRGWLLAGAIGSWTSKP